MRAESEGRAAMTHRKTLAILVGGGPAPGINSVIGAVTIRAALEGVEVLGIEDGFEWLMQGNVDHVRPLFFFRAEDGIRRLYVTGVQTCALPICSMPPITSTTMSTSGRVASACASAVS